MHPLFQRFEFSYPDGEGFWDRSGELAFKLRKMMPGLRVTGSAAEQRDFVDDAARRELSFGISLSSMSSTAIGDTQFIPLATAFLRELALSFGIQWLRRFSFRYALGHRCETRADAEALFWQMIGEEGRKQLRTLAPDAQTHALQTEFRYGPTEVMMRFAVIDFISDPTVPTKTDPYFAVIQEVSGNEPLAIGAFDAEAFMKNIATQQMEQVLDRIELAEDEQSIPYL